MDREELSSQGLGESAGDRTRDTYIKSVVLYQLSYRLTQTLE